MAIEVKENKFRVALPEQYLGRGKEIAPILQAYFATLYSQFVGEKRERGAFYSTLSLDNDIEVTLRGTFTQSELETMATAMLGQISATLH